MRADKRDVEIFPVASMIVQEWTVICMSLSEMRLHESSAYELNKYTKLESIRQGWQEHREKNEEKMEAFYESDLSSHLEQRQELLRSRIRERKPSR